MTTGAPQAPGVVCACGAPVSIRKTSECRTCYQRRWEAEKRAKTLAGVACVECGHKPCAEIARSGLPRCSNCARQRRKRHARTAALAQRFTEQGPTTYAGAHGRVRRIRGRAALWPCKDCGATAEQWAYVPGGPRERVTNESRGPRAWSPDPADYDPLCRPCHRIRDRKHPGPVRRTQAAHQRLWNRQSYARLVATPEGRRTYRERKKSGPHPARAWAQTVGIEVNTHGRVSNAVIRAWRGAGAPLTMADSNERNGVNEELTRVRAVLAHTRTPDSGLRPPRSAAR